MAKEILEIKKPARARCAKCKVEHRSEKLENGLCSSCRTPEAA